MNYQIKKINGGWVIENDLGERDVFTKTGPIRSKSWAVACCRVSNGEFKN